jgi:hypothetical protein
MISTISLPCGNIKVLGLLNGQNGGCPSFPMDLPAEEEDPNYLPLRYQFNRMYNSGLTRILRDRSLSPKIHFTLLDENAVSVFCILPRVKNNDGAV